MQSNYLRILQYDMLVSPIVENMDTDIVRYRTKSMIIGVSVRRVFMIHSIIRLPNLCGAQNLVSDYPSTISSFT